MYEFLLLYSKHHLQCNTTAYFVKSLPIVVLIFLSEHSSFGKHLIIKVS